MFCQTLAAGALSLIALSESATLVATDVIRAGEIITPANTSTGDKPSDTDNGLLMGRAVKRTVYAGQAIRWDNTQSPRLVLRNQMVTVRFVDGPLEMTLTGRALGEGGAGDAVDVMNLQSRQTIRGTVTEQGWVIVE